MTCKLQTKTYLVQLPSFIWDHRYIYGALWIFCRLAAVVQVIKINIANSSFINSGCVVHESNRGLGGSPLNMCSQG